MVIICGGGRKIVKHQVCGFLEALLKDLKRRRFSRFQKHFFEFLPIQKKNAMKICSSRPKRRACETSAPGV